VAGVKQLATILSSWILVLVSAPTVQAADGVFSLLCDFSHQLSDDPIMFPGQPGVSHLHQFTGNVTTNAGSTYESMLGQATSCPYAKDTAAYWVPALVSPLGTVIAPIRMNVYYRNKPSNGQPVVAFPPDFRLIAGHPTVPTGTKATLGWNCKDANPYLASPPDCRGIRSSRGVKAHIVFPNCWNGLPDSADHRSHVVYPSGGLCPVSHPLKLARLSVHVTWPVKDGRGYTLSSDHGSEAATGASLHADFWNTWDQPELERLTETCLNAQVSCKNLRDP
jgi:Domain of unknown function (DUF1996)